MAAFRLLTIMVLFFSNNLLGRSAANDEQDAEKGISYFQCLSKGGNEPAKGIILGTITGGGINPQAPNAEVRGGTYLRVEKIVQVAGTSSQLKAAISIGVDARCPFMNFPKGCDPSHYASPGPHRSDLYAHVHLARGSRYLFFLSEPKQRRYPDEWSLEGYRQVPNEQPDQLTKAIDRLKKTDLIKCNLE